jgi:hypothetical protein
VKKSANFTEPTSHKPKPSKVETYSRTPRAGLCISSLFFPLYFFFIFSFVFLLKFGLCISSLFLAFMFSSIFKRVKDGVSRSELRQKRRVNRVVFDLIFYSKHHSFSVSNSIILLKKHLSPSQNPRISPQN